MTTTATATATTTTGWGRRRGRRGGGDLARDVGVDGVRGVADLGVGDVRVAEGGPERARVADEDDQRVVAAGARGGDRRRGRGDVVVPAEAEGGDDVQASRGERGADRRRQWFPIPGRARGRRRRVRGRRRRRRRILVVTPRRRGRIAPRAESATKRGRRGRRDSRDRDREDERRASVGRRLPARHPEEIERASRVWRCGEEGDEAVRLSVGRFRARTRTRPRIKRASVLGPGEEAPAMRA